MSTRSSALLVWLRLAYLAAAVLFVAAVVVACVAAVTTMTGADGRFSITAEVPDGSPLDDVINWLALSTFIAAAVGALLTVVVRVRAAASIPSDG
ncbi:hypothetical protein ACEXQB_008760 [Herbiconiux sp. P18]|uniref:hypothetical protein n=1 Tax=Herbiconiux liangxiaofengii TaxID=3342795 RepID=UPI0035B7F718